MFLFCDAECSTAECQCQPPYKLVNGECTLSQCLKGNDCPQGAECITIAGGISYCACIKGLSPDQDGKCEGTVNLEYKDSYLWLVCKLMLNTGR